MWARAVLAEVLLVQGRPAEAQDQLNSAGALVAKSQNREWRLKYAIAAARVRAAMEKTGEATRSLEATLAEATKYSFIDYQFEARLALGKIEIESGKTAAGRARLAALEKGRHGERFSPFRAQSRGNEAIEAGPKRCRSDPGIGRPRRSKESAIYESSCRNPFGTHRLVQKSVLGTVGRLREGR